MKRVFEVDALRCPNCGGRMRLIDAITEAKGERQSLKCLELQPRATPLAPADALDPGPDSGERAFKGAFVEGQSDPRLDFDQIGRRRSVRELGRLIGEGSEDSSKAGFDEFEIDLPAVGLSRGSRGFDRPWAGPRSLNSPQ